MRKLNINWPLEELQIKLAFKTVEVLAGFCPYDLLLAMFSDIIVNLRRVMSYELYIKQNRENTER